MTAIELGQLAHRIVPILGSPPSGEIARRTNQIDVGEECAVSGRDHVDVAGNL
jgi:hypothetical protein